MTTELFQAYQEQTFDSFYKSVIRNKSVGAHRELAYRAKHETQLSALPLDDLSVLCSEDTYHPYRKTFYVLGQAVTIDSKPLADALQFILPQHRSIVLLSYFLGFNDVEIGNLLGISNQAVKARRAVCMI